MSLVKTLGLMFLEFFLNLLNTAHFFLMLTHRLIMACGGRAMIFLFGNLEVGSHWKNSYNVFDNYAPMGVKSPNNFLKEKSWAKWIQAKASQAPQAQQHLKVQHLLTVAASAWKRCVVAWLKAKRMQLVRTNCSTQVAPKAFATLRPVVNIVKKRSLCNREGIAKASNQTTEKELKWLRQILA